MADALPDSVLEVGGTELDGRVGGGRLVVADPRPAGGDGAEGADSD